MNYKEQILILSGLLFTTLVCMGSVTFAAETTDEYSIACRVCHTGTATPDVHHLMISQGIDCFYGCHQFKYDPIKYRYYLVNNGNVCFLNCHAPILYKDTSGFFDRVTSGIANSLGWDITNNAKTKMGDFHHQNYGAPITDCARCHESYWDPATNAWQTQSVAGSAEGNEEADNANNINIVIENDQLVYDVAPGGTLHVNATATEGDIITVQWSINNQAIPTAANNLDFVYTFKWGYPGDTFVVKLEVWSRDGRYAKQNVGVNIR